MTAVIFDMDGTLINSANAICMAVNEIRADLNLAPLEHKFIIECVNTPGKDWAKILYNIDNFTHTSFKEGFERYFVKHYKQSVVLYDGVAELLAWLKEQNAYLAIATNAPQSSLTAVLDKHGILGFFDKILGVSFGIEPKPHPMMLDLIRDEARILGDKSGNALRTCVFVGDSLKDKEAAFNAKMPFLHAKWSESAELNSEFSPALNTNFSVEKGENLSQKAEFASEFKLNSNTFCNANELKNLLQGILEQ